VHLRTQNTTSFGGTSEDLLDTLMRQAEDLSGISLGKTQVLDERMRRLANRLALLRLGVLRCSMRSRKRGYQSRDLVRQGWLNDDSDAGRFNIQHQGDRFACLCLNLL